MNYSLIIDVHYVYICLQRRLTYLFISLFTISAAMFTVLFTHTCATAPRLGHPQEDATSMVVMRGAEVLAEALTRRAKVLKFAHWCCG